MTIPELAKKYSRSRQRIWKWIDKLGIEPHYLGSIVHPKRKGVISYLDDDQVKQLDAYFKSRSHATQ